MTWQELADVIAKMEPEHRAEQARYVEPYDDENEGYVVEVWYARNPILVGVRGEETVFIEPGSPYLQ